MLQINEKKTCLKRQMLIKTLNLNTAVQNKTDEEEKIQNSFILDRF